MALVSTDAGRSQGTAVAATAASRPICISVLPSDLEEQFFAWVDYFYLRIEDHIGGNCSNITVQTRSIQTFAIIR